MIATRFLVVLACVVAAVVAEEKYTDKYDNVNVQEILSNKRLLLAYCDCCLDKGKCTPEGKELKEHMKDGLETGCSKCSENQKKSIHDVIEHLIKNEIECWKALCEKYDPEGTYRKKYEDLAKEHGITIPAK